MVMHGWQRGFLRRSILGDPGREDLPAAPGGGGIQGRFRSILKQLVRDGPEVRRHTHILASQNMVNRGQEEEETVEQARTQIERLRRLEGGRSSSDASLEESGVSWRSWRRTDRQRSVTAS